MAIDYLEYRAMTEPSNGNAGILRIRGVAEQLSVESSGRLNVHEIIKKLCTVVPKGVSPNLDIWIPSANTVDSDFETDLYVAALHTQVVPVIDRWLASGKTGWERSKLFGCSDDVAMQYGNHDLLAAMIKRHPDKDLQDARAGVLKAVIEYGRADATRFVFDFATDEYPWEPYVARLTRDTGDGQSFYWIYTPNKDVFDLVREKQKEHHVDWEPCERYLQFFTRACALRGWTEMLAYCLELEAEKQFSSREMRSITLDLRSR